MHLSDVFVLTRIDFLGVLAGCLSQFAVIPQIVKCYKSRSTNDLSLLTLTMSILGSSLWLVYGGLQHDKALIICNVIAVTLGAILLSFKIRFG